MTLAPQLAAAAVKAYREMKSELLSGAVNHPSYLIELYNLGKQIDEEIEEEIVG